MTTTEQAIDFLAGAIQEGQPDWSDEQIRAMLEHARPAIAANPDRFVDLFLDDVATIRNGQ